MEIIDLIFRPGFSSKEMITDISGRGVGLDIVLTNIRNLKGHIKVEIGSHKEDSTIVLSVRDDGYGIAATQQAKIFTKLFRADNIKTKDTEGNGLGLYMVKTMLEQAGCKIWFESKENEGTTFFVSIPEAGMNKKAGTKLLGELKS